ncbi:YciI family protein [Streptomyces sp. NPDC058373]|uniref:YciI family protein n=1 Tax=Streptomyces sp. NPDC058373 TaxID=3346465 RepID=UPI00366303DE
MKYLMLIHAASAAEDGSAEECHPSEWMAYEKEAREAGVHVSGESLTDLVTATTVQVGRDGRRTVADGPFAEGRELLGGFFVIDVPDLDAALDWAARCPGSQYGGAVVVRPIAVTLNRAIAVALRDGPAAGLALLDTLADEPSLRRHHPWAAARGELLERLGRYGEAAAA